MAEITEIKPNVGENMQEKTQKWDFFKIGFSSAASWAWGTSLIMGQQIAQQRGLTAWVIWAVCNALTLALFAWLFNHGKITREAFDRKEVKVIALIIQLFCLLVQMNFINQQILLLTGNPTVSYALTTGIGFFFTLIVFKRGLPTSIKTDVAQWGIAIASILVIIGIGIVQHAPLQTFAETSGSNVLWGVWSGLILFAGPIGDIQHWQRAESDSSRKGYYLGAVLFGLYMLEVLGMAVFQFNPLMNAVLLVAVLCVATSTIDSIAVALHELGNKKIGTAAALFICLFWGLFVNMGMIQLWSSFGVIRFAFAVGLLMLPLCAVGKKGVVLGVTAASAALIVLFSALGQITAASIAGVLSLVVAAAILVYVAVQAVRGGADAR